MEVVKNERSVFNSVGEVTRKLDIPQGILIAGIALIVLAISGAVVAYVLMGRKLNRYREKE